MAFYRGLWGILREHNIVTGGRSTQSVWIIDEEKIARQIHEHALKYGRSHIYNATPVG
jgi:alkyl hydroperoxide reductase subunit AhpC